MTFNCYDSWSLLPDWLIFGIVPRNYCLMSSPAYVDTWMKMSFQLSGERARDLLPRSWISSPRKHFCKANQSLEVQVNRTSKSEQMRSTIKNEGTISPSKFYSNIPRYHLQYQRGRSSSSGVLKYH